MWSDSQKPCCPDFSVLMKLQHLSIWLLHSSSVSITRMSSCRSVNICQHRERWTQRLQQFEAKCHVMLQAHCDGLCCPKECQKFTHLLRDLFSQLLSCSHWIFLMIFILFHFFPCWIVCLAMSFKFLSGKKGNKLDYFLSDKISLLPYKIAKVWLELGIRLRLILQIDFRVALFGGHIKINNWWMFCHWGSARIKWSFWLRVFQNF